MYALNAALDIQSTFGYSIIKSPVIVWKSYSVGTKDLQSDRWIEYDLAKGI